MKRYILKFVLIAVLIFNIPLNILSAGIETGTETDKRISEITSRIKISEKEIVNDGISSFTISDSGKIATDTANAGVNLYGENLNFLYSVRYKNNGPLYIKWSNDDLIIYLIKADACVKIKDKNIKSIAHIENTKDNQKIFNQLNRERDNEIQKNGYTYKDLSGKLVRIDSCGNEEVIVDTRVPYLLKILMILGSFSVCSIIVTIIIIKKWKNTNTI